jgi:hypothetical protein
MHAALHSGPSCGCSDVPVVCVHLAVFTGCLSTCYLWCLDGARQAGQPTGSLVNLTHRGLHTSLHARFRGSHGQKQLLCTLVVAARMCASVYY